MDHPVTVGIEEFQENLAMYLLESDTPVAITRDGETVGYFVPARRERSEADRAALTEAAEGLEAALAAAGLTEDEIIADFQRWRVTKRR